MSTINENNEFRAYHFNNMYLQGIHAGIQSAHTQTELALKYLDAFNDNQLALEMYLEWSKKHKTLICLNGGYLETMTALYSFIQDGEHDYPFASFMESEEALGGLLTNFVIILPQKVYSAHAELCRGQKYYDVFESTDSRSRYCRYNLLTELFDDINSHAVRPNDAWKEFNDKFGTLTRFDCELVDKIKQFRLAS